MRSSAAAKAKLASTCRFEPGNQSKITRLRAEYRAVKTAEYLRKVIDGFPPLAPEQISELRDILARLAINGMLRPSGTSRQPADRAAASRNATGGAGPTMSDDEYRGHGRTQWDAMAEATSEGKFRATRLALLMSVRYWPRTGAGALIMTLAYKLIEVLSHRH